MSDVNWAKLISKPDMVKNMPDVDLIFYHGVVGHSYFNNDEMLPGGYRSAVQKLYFAINEELMNRLCCHRSVKREEADIVAES